MKPIGLGGISVAVIAISLAIAVLASPGSSGSVDSTASALKVEGEVARAGLSSRLEAALGSSFGGAWYDPSGTELRIGVTSAADRRLAAAVTARAGLSDHVTEVPVDSSWDRLASDQRRLSRHLADLFARAEVSTSIAPQHNAVQVNLGSRVPAPRRALLESDAEAESIDVEVVQVTYPHIWARQLAQCNKFVSETAHCEPPVTAGVRIVSPTKGCTAGPAVVLQNPATAAQRTETYLLTAGHCIEKSGGKGVKWSAFDKSGAGPTEIGKAVDFLNGETDVGVIKVENAAWVKAGNIPVSPVYATWDSKAESEPAAVVGQLKPTLNAKTCFSGQFTGTACGKIKAESVEVKWENGDIGKELAEVSGTTVQEGDSGSPWLSGEPTTAGYVEGTTAGATVKGNPLFQPLEVSFAKLATKLKLLDGTNKTRHPFNAVSEGTPTILSGKKHGEKETLGTAIGSTICKGATYAGEMVGTQTAELSLTPSYSECTTAGIAATVDVNGCQYTFEPVAKEGSNFEASVDLVCPAGKQLEVTAMSCKITVPPQNDLKTVTFVNTGTGATRELTVTLNLVNIAYEEHKGGIIPCTSTVPKTNGTYTGSILITGVTGGGSHRGLWVE